MTVTLLLLFCGILKLSFLQICGPECSSELVGPVQKCVTCGEEFSFSSIKAHSDECMRYVSVYAYCMCRQTSDKGHVVHHQPTVEEHHVCLCVDVESTL